MADNEWQAIHGMGQGVVDSLYDALYAAYQAGKPGIAGNADPVIQVALAVGPGLSREQFVQIVREADKAKEGKKGQEFQQAMHGVVANWKQSLAPDLDKQRSEVAAFQGSSKHATSPSSGQWQKPAGAKTTQFAKASGGSAPVTALGNTPENTGGVATDPAVAHHNPTSTPPVTASPTSAATLSSTLGRPADDDAEPGRKPDGTVPQKEQSEPFRRPAKPDYGQQFLKGLAGVGIGMLGQQIDRSTRSAGLGGGLGNLFAKSVSASLGLPMMGGWGGRQRGANGQFASGGMTGILGSGGLGEMLAGSVGNSAGSSVGDSSSQLIEVIRELKVAVEKLTASLQGQQGEKPGLRPDGTFVPSIKGPPAGSADAVTQAALAAGQQGSSSNDMLAQVQQILMRVAMSAAMAAI